MMTSSLAGSASHDDTAHGVVMAAREMARSGLVVGTVGNVSARLRDGFVITPTRVDYELVEPMDLAYVALSRRGPPPEANASREAPLHAAVYRARPDIGAVVHTHSVHATAWSFLNVPLGPPIEEIEYYGIGEIRTSTPATAGSSALGENAVESLAGGAAVLLGRHGVVAVGRDPAEALTIARVVELQAQVAWLLRRNTSLFVPRERPQ
jgi:L-fuculose-phosphate aldolase